MTADQLVDCSVCPQYALFWGVGGVNLEREPFSCSVELASVRVFEFSHQMFRLTLQFPSIGHCLQMHF